MFWPTFQNVYFETKLIRVSFTRTCSLVPQGLVLACFDTFLSALAFYRQYSVHQMEMDLNSFLGWVEAKKDIFCLLSITSVDKKSLDKTYIFISFGIIGPIVETLKMEFY